MLFRSPPLLPEPPRFRAPTAREAEIDSAWRAYIDLSDRFYSALFLYDSSVRRAVLDVLRRDVSRERQERIDRTLKGLTAAQEDSIKALARR